MRAGQSWLRWTGPAASDQSPEPLVWTVEGDSDTAVNRIESNRFHLFPNRPSLVLGRVSIVRGLRAVGEGRHIADIDNNNDVVTTCSFIIVCLFLSLFLAGCCSGGGWECRHIATVCSGLSVCLSVCFSVPCFCPSICIRIESNRLVCGTDSNRFLFCRIAHHYLTVCQTV